MKIGILLAQTQRFAGKETAKARCREECAKGIDLLHLFLRDLFASSRFRGLFSFSFSKIVLLEMLAVLALSGCIGAPQHPAATQPSTTVDLATTQPSYWLAQPATAVVDSIDFDKLVSACQSVAQDYLFTIDRVDYRSGLITTQPLVSSQWFEPWRFDNRTLYDVEESSIATIRRTIRFEITKQPDLTWQMTPKVLVERQTIAERRITSVVLYRSVFSQVTQEHLRPTGTAESDEGVIIQPRYWYLLRRDPDFERVLARSVDHKLHARK